MVRGPVWELARLNPRWGVADGTLSVHKDMLPRAAIDHKLKSKATAKFTPGDRFASAARDAPMSTNRISFLPSCSAFSRWTVATTAESSRKYTSFADFASSRIRESAYPVSKPGSAPSPLSVKVKLATAPDPVESEYTRTGGRGSTPQIKPGLSPLSAVDLHPRLPRTRRGRLPPPPTKR